MDETVISSYYCSNKSIGVIMAVVTCTPGVVPIDLWYTPACPGPSIEKKKRMPVPRSIKETRTKTEADIS